MNGMTYQEIIDKYGGFVYYPVGTSMLPLIREGLDSVKLVAINDNIKKYDVLLYKRNNHQFVLHRVVKVHHDSYDFMGDNQWVIEKNIKRSQIIAR
ncbi:MAG TPA: S24/S26 family peptidase, partial [Bacilli bacterium]|nr:S24/S26 family peptidase [Bacilli bacterium]